MIEEGVIGKNVQATILYGEVYTTYLMLLMQPYSMPLSHLIPSTAFQGCQIESKTQSGLGFGSRRFFSRRTYLMLLGFSPL